MSCEVKSFATIPDLKKVQEHFGFSLDENWLNAVYYSISPTGETIAFGHGNKIIILGAQWSQSNQQQLPTYQITWKGELDNENDIITAILCVPIYGPNINSGADWTCIIIGLASGLVAFYSDSGLQIFSQRWHNENVQSVKAQSGNRLAEEVHIYYLSCVCILNGTELFSTLKGHKQNLSKTLKSTTSTRTTNLTQFADTIQCRKWEYRTRSDSSINDACIVGSNQKQSIFDHYLEQSLEKGYYAKLRSSPAQNSLVLGVGVKPYCGFYFAKEGFVHADLGDVAKAMANKVISSLPGWFFGSNKTKSTTSKDNISENEQPIESGEPMICRFGICDIQRQAFNIWLAPDNNLAVVTDNLSRVILIDCNRGIAIRIWKGYRDAQCAFMKIKEKTLKGDKTEKRKSLFLIIYAPRRSCLEIWTLQHGPKVAAFNISKNGQLSYTTYGLMGINPGAKVKFNVNSCLFLDPSDDTLKEIQIPFHCSLNDSNSNTAKDVHLLKRMKLYIRNDTNENDIIPEIQELCSNIKTDEIRLQLLEMLSKNKKLKPKMFLVAIETLKTSINCEMTSEQSELNNSFDRNVSHHHSRLLILLENYEKLINFYISLKETKSDTSEKLNFPKLSLTENDLETIQKLLDLTIDQKLSAPHINTNKVKFQDNKQNSSEFIEFLSIFNIENNELILNDNKMELYGYIGGHLFSRFLEKGYDFNGFIESTTKFNIPSEDFIVLVLHYWLEKQFSYTKCEEIIDDMARLSIIIRHICDLAGEKVQVDYNAICQWWQNVREMLLESSSALKSLLAGIVCRNVSHSLKRKNRDSSSDDGEEMFEEVSQETAQWSLLIGKLDDISVLGAILSFPVTSTNPVMPIIPYEKPDSSLKRIICGGKGIVSELFAKWLTNSGIHPKKLSDSENVTDNTVTKTDTNNDADENSNISKENIDPVIQHYHHLREHFPFSLESGILYCQMTWEFMSYWSKNLPKLEYLKAGLICLDSFCISDLALKHGLCCMIWNAHLKIPLEATKKLIHKVGRLPKEKLCQQDIGMSVTSVPEFLECTLEFLKHFLSSLEHEKRELQYEEILQNEQIPLSFLALQQNHAIYDIVKLHIELCKVLHLIAFFSLKLTKPITLLFDAMANQTFFIEINRELNYKLPVSDLVMKKNREEFLCHTVSASMDLIREDLERLYVLEHATYMNKIEELANLWDLEKNFIKKHQVVEMYAHGWDAYAEELLEAIADQESIGQLLLEIAGRRLNLYSSKSQSIFCHVASIGPQLLNYLDNLKTKTTGCQITAELPEEIELEPMLTLAAKAFHCLSSKESKSLHIAGQLFDACSLLKSLSSTID